MALQHWCVFTLFYSLRKHLDFDEFQLMIKKIKNKNEDYLFAKLKYYIEDGSLYCQNLLWVSESLRYDTGCSYDF